MIADFNCLAQEPAGVSSKIEHEAFHIGEAVDGLIDFLRGSLLKLCEMNVTDAGADFIFEIDRRMGL